MSINDPKIEEQEVTAQQANQGGIFKAKMSAEVFEAEASADNKKNSTKRGYSVAFMASDTNGFVSDTNSQQAFTKHSTRSLTQNMAEIRVDASPEQVLSEIQKLMDVLNTVQARNATESNAKAISALSACYSGVQELLNRSNKPVFSYSLENNSVMPNVGSGAVSAKRLKY